MKVLSLFDGMGCAYISLKELGINISRYVAYEVDKYAITASTHNAPIIEHKGDVFKGDYTEYQDFDFLMGGSPCTFWSVAQSPDKRETTNSGFGWELFSQYVRALHEAKPKYFIYENNKSMSKDIRKAIDESFGFEAVLINSALVSAQNRNRLYWVGKRNEQGGYDKVDVEQPADRGILLKDILDDSNTIVFDSHSCGVPCGDSKNKSYTITARHGRGFTSFRGYNACLTPICVNSQSGDRYNKRPQPSVHDRIYDVNGKKPAIHTAHQPSIAEPTCVAQRGRYSDTGNRHSKSEGEIEQHFEARADGKTNTLTCVQKDNHVAEPIQTDETGKSRPLQASYGKYAASDSFKQTKPRSGVAEPIEFPYRTGSEIKISERNIRCEKGGSCQESVVFFEDSTANALTTAHVPKVIVSEPSKHPKAYEVKNGQITIEIKGEPRTYPIKLADGFYTIRKLTVSECMRLQTIPEWYDFSCISKTQAYKMCGNGWTVEVIKHLIQSCLTAE